MSQRDAGIELGERKPKKLSYIRCDMVTCEYIHIYMQMNGFVWSPLLFGGGSQEVLCSKNKGKKAVLLDSDAPRS
jgi:hypothetical protein